MPDDLTRIEVLLDQHRTLLVGLHVEFERLAMQQTALWSSLSRQDERLDRMEQALVAIKDLLDRGHGH